MNMELLNKKYHCELEVISPLHIGAGPEKNWINGADFVYDEQRMKIIRLNMNAMANILGIDVLSHILLLRNQKLLKAELAKKGKKLADVADQEFYFEFTPSDEIKTLVRNALNNKPLVPGSSIKGAIRSILFKHLKGTSNREQDVFGSANNGDEFMRYIKISDAAFDKSDIMQAKIYNLANDGSSWKGSWKHERKNGNTAQFKNTGFHTTYEVIPPGELGCFELMFADKAFQLFNVNNLANNNASPDLKNSLPKKRELMNGGISALFRLINAHTKGFIEKEKAYFAEYNQADYAAEILDYHNYLLEQTELGDNSCLMRMASGSGFFGMTGDWKFKDHLSSINKPDLDKKGNPIFYKSRRIVFAKYEGEYDFNPMGYVLMSLKA